jgi:hypothetical protein
MFTSVLCDVYLQLMGLGTLTQKVIFGAAQGLVHQSNMTLMQLMTMGLTKLMRILVGMLAGTMMMRK